MQLVIYILGDPSKIWLAKGELSNGLCPIYHCSETTRSFFGSVSLPNTIGDI